MMIYGGRGIGGKLLVPTQWLNTLSGSLMVSIYSKVDIYSKG